MNLTRITIRLCILVLLPTISSVSTMCPCWGQEKQVPPPVATIDPLSLLPDNTEAVISLGAMAERTTELAGLLEMVGAHSLGTLLARVPSESDSEEDLQATFMEVSSGREKGTRMICAYWPTGKKPADTFESKWSGIVLMIAARGTFTERELTRGGWRAEAPEKEGQVLFSQASIEQGKTNYMGVVSSELAVLSQSPQFVAAALKRAKTSPSKSAVKDWSVSPAVEFEAAFWAARKAGDSPDEPGLVVSALDKEGEIRFTYVFPPKQSQVGVIKPGKPLMKSSRQFYRLFDYGDELVVKEVTKTTVVIDFDLERSRQGDSALASIMENFEISGYRAGDKSP